MHKVISVLPQEDYKMLVAFENGERRIYNAAPLLRKPVFMLLKDIRVFQKAYIEYGAVTWKDQDGNEVDICPDKMYMDSISCDDLAAIAAAREDLAKGETVSHNAINWD